MGKIQPFKAIGKGLQFAAPFIPGVGGMAAGLGGSLLAGGGGGKKKSGAMQGLDPAVIQRMLALANEGSSKLLDTQGMVERYRSTTGAAADQAGQSIGAQAAQATGNDALKAGAVLNARNNATQQGNEFQGYVTSPEGQAEAYQGALSLYGPVVSAMLGQGGQHLQKYQIGKEYAKPTVLESITNAGLGVLPQLLQNWLKRQGVASSASNTSSGGYGQTAVYAN